MSHEQFDLFGLPYDFGDIIEDEGIAVTEAHTMQHRARFIHDYMQERRKGFRGICPCNEGRQSDCFIHQQGRSSEGVIPIRIWRKD